MQSIDSIIGGRAFLGNGEEMRGGGTPTAEDKDDGVVDSTGNRVDTEDTATGCCRGRLRTCDSGRRASYQDGERQQSGKSTPFVGKL